MRIAKQKFNNILASEEFSAEEYLLNDPQHNRYIIKGKHKDAEAIIKIISINDFPRLKRFEKDLLIDKIIKSTSSNNTSFNFQKVLSAGGNKEYFWVMKEYVRGETLSDFDKNLPLWSYDKIKNKFVGKNDDVLPAVLNNLNSIQQLYSAFKKNSENGVFNSKYPRVLEDISAEVSDYLKFDFSKGISYFNSIKEEYFDEKNITLCIGDLSPSNILVKSDGDLMLFDFETMCYETKYLDVSYLWMFLWRYPNWQNKLLDLSLFSNMDKEYFRLTIFRLLAGYLYKWPAVSISLKNEPKRLNMIKHHIWSRYLFASCDSYEALINTK